MTFHIDQRKPILCLDFDGVIHSYTSGWQGADVIPDLPVEGAKEFIQDALCEFRIVILSSRSNHPGGIEAMRAWMKSYGLDAFNEIEFVQEKPPAFITIDDRAITFEGVWPSIQRLKEFKPWNKKKENE